MTNKCHSGAQVAAYLEDALGPKERRDFEAHLRQCERCAQEVEQLRTVDHLISRQRCPPQDVRLAVALGKFDSPGASDAAEHMHTCPYCRQEVAAANDALNAEVRPEAVSPTARKRFLEGLSRTVEVALAQVPTEEGAPPLVAWRTLGQIELELQFAGTYSGLSVAIGLRERGAARPLVGIPVAVRGADGKVRAEAVTDSQGVARLALRTLGPAQYAIELGTERPTALTLDVRR